MNIWYIKETEKIDSFFNKVKLKYKKIFNIISKKQIDGKVICEVPIEVGNTTSQNKIISVAKRINKILYDNDILNVVLSNKLYEIEALKVKLFCNNINIINGRTLFKYLIYDIVNYILNKKSKEIEKAEISILVNDDSNINIQNIIMIAKNIKITNIITNNIKKFRKVEEYLYENFGIMIRISNNKNKSLLNSDLIINMDFPCEIINKYNIPNNGIIININDKVPIHSKKFNGININYYNIDIPKEFKLQGFSNEVIYESLIYANRNFVDVRKKIKQDNIIITSLIGNNGIITEKEFCN